MNNESRNTNIKKSVLWSLSRGAEIKLPPGARAEIRNCGSSPFYIFNKDKETILILLLRTKKVWYFSRYLIKLSGAEAGAGLGAEILIPRKKYIRLHNTDYNN
jgi:hypothetical protein